MEPLRLAAPKVRCAPSSKLANVCKLAVHCRRKINSARVVVGRSNRLSPYFEEVGPVVKVKRRQIIHDNEQFVHSSSFR
jgi:hypothetical protein